MSPIFDHYALRGLSTATLNHLCSIIKQRLGAIDLSEREYAQLHTALADIYAVLRGRAVPPRPAPSAPSP